MGNCKSLQCDLEAKKYLEPEQSKETFLLQLPIFLVSLTLSVPGERIITPLYKNVITFERLMALT